MPASVSDERQEDNERGDEPERDTQGHAPGGAEPLGGEDTPESQNADIPAAG